MNFWIIELICIIIQFIAFLPFYIIWRKDCKEIGKENLAVSLSERFAYWLVLFPAWVIPILQIAK